MMAEKPELFKQKVQESLRRHVAAINRCVERFGTYFFDYGNAFLLESSRAGADILKPNGDFKYPSYVQDIMGPMCFDYGFGPFRWVCTSGKPEDLAMTDALATEVLEKLAAESPADIQQQMHDNIRWIKAAGENHLVVGSQARILYADAEGRIRIAEAFNRAIRDGRLSAPVVLGRDHHDVSGTDSPYRETSNIYDGSRFTADMAVQNVIGDSFRGATWVSLHNGGGVGWGDHNGQRQKGSCGHRIHPVGLTFKGAVMVQGVLRGCRVLLHRLCSPFRQKNDRLPKQTMVCLGAKF